MLWRNVGRRSLWREMDRLQREMNRLVDGLPGTGGGFPAVNVWANQEHALITAEVPGIDPDQLEISVVGDSVTLSGERAPVAEDEGTRYHRRERWQGGFSRTMQMPFRIDAEKVEASYNAGVLEIALPRAEEDKPRRISVNGNHS